MNTVIAKYLALLLVFTAKTSLVADVSVIEFTEDQKDRLIHQVENNNGQVNKEIISFYLDSLETNAVQKQVVSGACHQWIQKHPQIRQGLFGAAYPVRTAMLKDLDRFRIGLGQKADTYANLILACSYYTDHSLKEKYQPPDQTEAVDKICAYMQQNNLTLVDVVSNESTVLPELSITITKKDREALWEEVALRTGTYPTPQTNTRLEFMSYLINRYEKDVTITPKNKELSTKKPFNYVWPQFPIDTALWPTLIPLGATVPLNECNFIWERFINGEGISRYAKYGRQYNKPEVKYAQSIWHPQSAPRILQDGGVCGRLSGMARKSNLALGIPTMHMGQPKHSAYAAIKYSKEDGYTINKGHSIAPDYKSNVVWPLRNARGWRTSQHNNKCNIEYHHGFVTSLNTSLETFIESRICINLIEAVSDLSTDNKIRVLKSALTIDPYNTEAYYRLAECQMNDLDAIHSLVKQVRSYGNFSELSAEQERNADDDLQNVAIRSSTKKDSLNIWSLMVSSIIIEQVYTLGTYSPEQTKRALSELQAELEFQKSLEKSAHLHPIQQLVNQYEINVNGIEPTLNRVQAETMDLLRLLSKNNSENLKQVNKSLKVQIRQIDLVLNNLTNVNDRISLLEKFEAEFPAEQIASKPKDKVKTNGFYDFIRKKLTSYYKETGDTDKADILSDKYSMRKKDADT